MYLIFNEGYTASSGDRLIRADLCAEAIRLGRLLAELVPDEPEVLGLLALMLLIESRRAARTTPEGDLVLLAEQDRGRWDRGLIAEGQSIVRQCLLRDRPGPYQIQAAINAVHSDAAVAPATDWWQILQLYNQLISLAPSPVVALNRAVAVAEVEGPDAALTVADGLDLAGYHMFHAIRADLLRRLGRRAEAALAYEEAIALTANATERAFLDRSRKDLTAPSREQERSTWPRTSDLSRQSLHHGLWFEAYVLANARLYTLRKYGAGRRDMAERGRDGVPAPPTSGLPVRGFGDRGDARTLNGIHTLTFIGRAELGEQRYQLLMRCPSASLMHPSTARQARVSRSVRPGRR